MKIWLLWRCGIDHDASAPFWLGLAEVAGVAFDEEEAREIEAALVVRWAREHPVTFQRLAAWTFETYVDRPADTPVDALTDEDILAAFATVGAPYHLEEIELEPLLSGVDRLDANGRRELLRGLAEVVRAFDPAAADALVEEDAP